MLEGCYIEVARLVPPSTGIETAKGRARGYYRRRGIGVEGPRQSADEESKMEIAKKAVIIAEMLDRIIRAGSWAGDTHLQKGMFFLQTMRGVPTGYDFVLYRYGPYSFGLRDDLIPLQSFGIIEVSPKPYPYGPGLATGESSRRLRARFSKTLARYDADFSFVADHFGSLNAGESERLATAHYFYLEGKADLSHEEVAHQVNAVKPHISFSEGVEAARRVRSLAESSRSR